MFMLNLFLLNLGGCGQLVEASPEAPKYAENTPSPADIARPLANGMAREEPGVTVSKEWKNHWRDYR